MYSCVYRIFEYAHIVTNNNSYSKGVDYNEEGTGTEDKQGNHRCTGSIRNDSVDHGMHDYHGVRRRRDCRYDSYCVHGYLR